MEFPSYGVEKADQAGFADTATEERVGCERAEGVIADLGVSWGCAAVDEGDVVVCRENRGIEKDEPDVDPQG